MSCTIQVSETLTVETLTGGDPHTVIERAGAGLVRIEPGELAGLTAALATAAGRLGIEGLDNTGSVVRLARSLPCGVTGGGDVPCGRPAVAAYLDPDPERAGAWVLTPVCKVCAAAMAAMYGNRLQPTR